MSRIGKQPIKIPEGVNININSAQVVVSGPKGKIKHNLPKAVFLEKKKDYLEVSTKDRSKQGKANFGTTRALLANIVLGVTNGWVKQLELVGTGYRSETDGKTLTLTVGFSHPVKIEETEGISYKVEKNIITVEGIDKQLVGHLSAKIRSVRPPEPYKGKGIKYIDEIIRRKAGKAAKAVGAI
ncbi:50S ribosomal protein L6 [Patescibacteria group bacterium]|nr:50S ribosomal protein L6 [Patescibacteria group bacterium]MBU2036286.1 50S ribosomal protein L6 [Patescibacteria group bacterium]